MRVKITKKEMKEGIGGLLRVSGWLIGVTAVVTLVLLIAGVMDTPLELWEVALRMALVLAGSVAAIFLGRKLYPPRKKTGAKKSAPAKQAAPQNCCARCGVDLKLLKPSQKGKGTDGRLYCDVCLGTLKNGKTALCDQCHKTFPTGELLPILGKRWCRDCWASYTKQGGNQLTFYDVENGTAAMWKDGGAVRYMQLCREEKNYALYSVKADDAGNNRLDRMELTAEQVKDEASFRAAVGEKIANRGVTDAFCAFIHGRQLRQKQEALAKEQGTPLFDSKDESCLEEGIAYQRTDTVMLCADGRLLLRQFSAARDTAAPHIGATVDTPLVIFKPLTYGDLPELIKTSKDPKAAKYKGMTAQNWRDYLPAAPGKAEALQSAPKGDEVRLFEAGSSEEYVDNERAVIHYSIRTVILSGGELFLESKFCTMDGHTSRGLGSSTTRKPLTFGDLPELIKTSKDPKAAKYKGMTAKNWRDYLPAAPKKAEAPQSAPRKQAPKTAPKPTAPPKPSPKTVTARLFEARRWEDVDERQFVHQAVDTVILNSAGELYLEQSSCTYDAYNCARVFNRSSSRKALKFSDLPGLIAKSRDSGAAKYKGMDETNWWQFVPGWEKYAPVPKAKAPQTAASGASDPSRDANFFTWLCDVTPKRELEWGQSEYYALDTRNGTPYYIKEQYDGRCMAGTWYLHKNAVTWEEVKQQLEEGDPQRRSKLAGIGPDNWKEKLFRTIFCDDSGILIDCNAWHGYTWVGVRWQAGKRILTCETGRGQGDISSKVRTRELTEEMCLSLREFRKAAESFVTQDYVIRQLWVWVITHCQAPGKRLVQTEKCYGSGFYEHACAYRDEIDGKQYFCHFEGIPVGRYDDIQGFHTCRISETEYEKLKADKTYRVKKGRYLGVTHGQEDLCRWILAKALRENRCFVWMNFGGIETVWETCHLTWSPVGMPIPRELMKQGYISENALESYIHQLDHVVARRTCNGNRNYDHAVEYVYGKDNRLYYCYLSEIPDRNSSIGWEVDEITSSDFEKLMADRSYRCSPLRHLGMIPDIYMGGSNVVGAQVLTKALTEFRSFQWKSTGFRKWDPEPTWLERNYPPVGTVIDLGKGDWAGKAERGEAVATLRRTYPGWHLRLEMVYFNLYGEQPKGEPSLKEQNLPLDITPEKLSDLICSLSGVRFAPEALADKMYFAVDPQDHTELGALKNLILARAEALYRNPHTEPYRRYDRDEFHSYVKRLSDTEISDGEFLTITPKGYTWAFMERGQGNACIQETSRETFVTEFLRQNFFQNCVLALNDHYCGMIRKDGELYLADYCSDLLVKGSRREAEPTMRKWLTYPVTFCGWGAQGAAFRINREALREEEPTLCCWCDDGWLEHDPEPYLENVLRYSSGISAARVEKRRCADGKERTCLMLRLKENSIRETVRIDGKDVPARELGGYVFALPRSGEFRVWIGEAAGSKLHPLYEDDFCMK